MKIQILLGSTRPGRLGKEVGEWVMQHAQSREGVEYELVDIADFALPLLDEPAPPMMQQYTKDHTKNWSSKISEADGYIFITPEYNHGVPGAFKNAVDYLYHEWVNKAVGFIGYGSAGGVRAVENWRLISAELQMADVREQVRLYLDKDFENYSSFKPEDHHQDQLAKLFEQVEGWSKAMLTVRKTS